MDNNAIKEYYASGVEENRLNMDVFRLEGLRTKEIIERYLLRPSMRVADIGGGTGVYSYWLQKSGHDVSLVDLSPENITLAKRYGERIGIRLSRYAEGDATALDLGDDQYDLVLLLGPLYHLTERQKRIRALAEAARVLKPGGILLAAVISRYASLFDGVRRDLIKDAEFQTIVLQDLKTGIHINHTSNAEYFTTAFFHTPAEIRDEIIESNLHFEKLVAVESVGWIVDHFNEKFANEAYAKRLLQLLALVESNDDLIASSPHIIAVAKKVSLS